MVSLGFRGSLHCPRTGSDPGLHEAPRLDFKKGIKMIYVGNKGKGYGHCHIIIAYVSGLYKSLFYTYKAHYPSLIPPYSLLRGFREQGLYGVG